MKRVLLTGAGGFVGHHTLEHLLVNTDWEIVCLDSFRHRGKTDRIREVLDGQRAYNSLPAASPGDAYDRTKVLSHDLRVPISAQLDREIGPINYVISMASDSHVDRSCVEPRPFIENNVALVLTLLEWTRHRARLGPDGIEKFVHVSTDEVYGPAPVGHDHVEGEPHRPSNPYSASKACQEDIVYSYWRTFGLPVAISNTMNIIGERQDPEKFVPLVLAKVLKGEKVTIHAGPATDVRNGETVHIADGRPMKPGSRFYLHARNQADALLFLLQKQPFHRYGDPVPAPKGPLTPDEQKRVLDAGGGISQRRMGEAEAEVRAERRAPAEMGRFNVVGEREIDNLQMAKMIAAAADRDLDYELVDFHSSRPGHDLRYALDGTKMTDLGWTPPVPLGPSLQKTVEWSLAHPEWLLP